VHLAKHRKGTRPWTLRPDWRVRHCFEVFAPEWAVEVIALSVRASKLYEGFCLCFALHAFGDNREVKGLGRW